VLCEETDGENWEIIFLPRSRKSLDGKKFIDGERTFDSHYFTLVGAGTIIRGGTRKMHLTAVATASFFIYHHLWLLAAAVVLITAPDNNVALLYSCLPD
jgi:hypothetical protein